MTSTTTAIALPWVVLVSIMSFLALIGNILVIVVIIQDRYLKGLNYNPRSRGQHGHIGCPVRRISYPAYTRECLHTGQLEFG